MSGYLPGNCELGKAYPYDPALLPDSSPVQYCKDEIPRETPNPNDTIQRATRGLFALLNQAAVIGEVYPPGDELYSRLDELVDQIPFKPIACKYFYPEIIPLTEPSRYPQVQRISFKSLLRLSVAQFQLLDTDLVV